MAWARKADSARTSFLSRLSSWIHNSSCCLTLVRRLLRERNYLPLPFSSTWSVENLLNWNGQRWRRRRCRSEKNQRGECGKKCRPRGKLLFFGKKKPSLFSIGRAPFWLTKIVKIPRVKTATWMNTPNYFSCKFGLFSDTQGIFLALSIPLGYLNLVGINKVWSQQKSVTFAPCWEIASSCLSFLC